MADQRDDAGAAFQAASQQFQAAAEKLERAAAHCRIAAKHFTDRDVPRGCAHAFAALGDIAIASAAIGDNAKLHAAKSSIAIDPGRT